MTKHCVLSCSILSLLLCYGALAQNEKVPSLDLINVIYYLDSTSNALVASDRQIVTAKTKLRALGFGGYRVVGEVKGERSSLRLKAGQKLEFVVQVPLGVDPIKFRLYRFEAKGNKRQIVFGSGTLLTGKSGSYYQVNITRFGEFSYKLTPANTLTQGEYGFISADFQEVFCFGLDK